MTVSISDLRLSLMSKFAGVGIPSSGDDSWAGISHPNVSWVQDQGQSVSSSPRGSGTVGVLTAPRPYLIPGKKQKTKPLLILKCGSSNPFLSEGF